LSSAKDKFKGKVCPYLKTSFSFGNKILIDGPALSSSELQPVKIESPNKNSAANFNDFIYFYFLNIKYTILFLVLMVFFSNIYFNKLLILITRLVYNKKSYVIMTF